MASQEYYFNDPQERIQETGYSRNNTQDDNLSTDGIDNAITEDKRTRMKTPISGDQGIRTILNKNTQQVTNKQHEKAERMEMQYLSRSLSREREKIINHTGNL